MGGADGGADNEGKERVKVWQTFRGNEWDNLGEVRGEGWVQREDDGMGLVVEVRPLGERLFYHERGGCMLGPITMEFRFEDSRRSDSLTVASFAAVSLQEPDGSDRAVLAWSRHRRAISA